MTSTAEREIRDAVVARLRELAPDARIVHELNCSGQGTNRIDVAAITRDVIVGVEIKSEKDVLKRLTDQLTAFRKCCHIVVVAAHSKHFKEYRGDWRADVPSEYHLDHPEFYGRRFSYGKDVWKYPRPDKGSRGMDTWHFDLVRHTTSWKFPLRSSDLLQMLWAEELRIESGRHRLPCGSRENRGTMIQNMSMLMTGQEVSRAVCRQLRARSFAEADAPIFEEKVASA
ncbi:hypothetical protein NAC44_12075 [Allorhizobium sp. BGMRC 0089]|uniref:hypothetical protein n=1 Tax=Allorhizobium sonneratiae TaxID=2934936 RepID=UPI00203472BA|nr:hypothetical protein [Allorhizobium sonneratiae]MCM2293060.1 hypothetical protein [Allorhizobium sonneratiae]